MKEIIKSLKQAVIDHLGELVLFAWFVGLIIVILLICFHIAKGE